MRFPTLLLTLVSLFILFVDLNAQVQIAPTAGNFQRGAIDPSGGAAGTFRFTALNTDINGSVVNTAGGGVYTACEFGFGGPCAPGSTLDILENVTGQTTIRQNITPVTVNGTTHQTIFYNGSTMRLEAGAPRLPWYMAKRGIVKVTYTARLTGILNGRPTPSAEPIFQANLDLLGTVTLTLKRNTSVPGTYSLTGVDYNFAEN